MVLYYALLSDAVRLPISAIKRSLLALLQKGKHAECAPGAPALGYSHRGL